MIAGAQSMVFALASDVEHMFGVLGCIRCKYQWDFSLKKKYKALPVSSGVSWTEIKCTTGGFCFCFCFAVHVTAHLGCQLDANEKCEEETAIEGLPLSDWPVSKSYLHKTGL